MFAFTCRRRLSGRVYKRMELDAIAPSDIIVDGGGGGGGGGVRL